MASGHQVAVLRYIHQLFGRGSVAGLSEGQLLEAFVAQGDQEAFAGLLARHGPMVLAVCRRMLDDPRDVEDAFQATFLVLVRKAGAIRDREMLGPWLYGVTRKVAARARSEANRRSSRERPGEELVMTSDREGDHRDLKTILDEEVGRLPEKYRAPVVLCYLEGRTHDQAAAQLDCPVGTVRSRLAWARDRLGARLTRRGVTLPAGFLVVAITSEAVPATLAEATAKAALATLAGRAVAAGAVSAAVERLTQGVIQTMFLNKLTVVTASLMAVGLVSGGATVLAIQAGGDGPMPAKAAPARAGSPENPSDRLQSQLEVARKQADEAQKRLAATEAEIKILRQQIRKTQGRVTGRGGMMPGMPGMGMPAMPGMPGAGGMEVMGGGMMRGMPPGMVGMMGEVGDEQRLIHGFVNAGGRSKIVAQTPENDGLSVYDVNTGKRVRYHAPKGVKCVPVINGTIVAVQAIGDEVTQVAVLNDKDDGWSTQDLREPANGQVAPQVQGELVVYTVGRFVYAFNATSGKWAVLELDKDAEPVVNVMTGIATVESGRHLYVYIAKFSRWDDVAKDD